MQKAFKTTVTYVGGHSQGAFLTYNVILNNPDLYRGAFPIAGDCWIQNEPSIWENQPDVAKKQHEIAIAVIHGQADPVVAFSQGQHAYDCFRAAGWTKLRMFAPKNLNHAFMLSPVDEAIEWLDAMNGLVEPKLQTLAGKWAREGEWGWVREAARTSRTAAALTRAADDAATKALPAITAAMKGSPSDWIPKWTEFRRIHAGAPAAKALVDDLAARRETQRAGAIPLFNESQSLFRAGKKDDAFKVLEKLRDEHPATYQGFFAWRWLSERK